MIVAIVIYVSILLLCALLALVSYVERLYSESGKFLTRDFQENIEAFENLVEPRLTAASGRAPMAISLLVQFSTATITLLIGYLVFSDQHSTSPEVIQAIVGIVLVIIICNRLLPYVMFTRTNGDWLVRFLPLLKTLVYLMIPFTIVLGFGLSVAALAEPQYARS